MNYYEILGISNNATIDEIKTAYRTLSKKYHPDVNDATNASAFFRLIQEAYETLSKEDLRSAYDKSTQYVHSETNYSYEPTATEAEQTCYRNSKTESKIAVVILKVILTPLLPVLAFLSHCAILLSGIIITVCRILYGILVLGLIASLLLGELTFSFFIQCLIMAFILFCLQNIILILPAGLSGLSERIKDFIFLK